MKKAESALGWLIFGLLGLGAVMIGLVLAGAFDPRPEGNLLVEYPLGQMMVPAGQTNIEWLGEELPAGAFSLRLRAAAQGDSFVGYGLSIGRPGSYLAVLVSPTGYVSMTPEPGRGYEDQWHTWPHIHLAQASNDIQIDKDEANWLIIRLNSELFWQGKWPIMGNQVGLVVQSFENQAVVDFQSLALSGPIP